MTKDKAGETAIANRARYGISQQQAERELDYIIRANGPKAMVAKLKYFYFARSKRQAVELVKALLSKEDEK